MLYAFFLFILVVDYLRLRVFIRLEASLIFIIVSAGIIRSYILTLCSSEHKLLSFRVKILDSSFTSHVANRFGIVLQDFLPVLAVGIFGRLMAIVFIWLNTIVNFTEVPIPVTCDSFPALTTGSYYFLVSIEENKVMRKRCLIVEELPYI